MVSGLCRDLLARLRIGQQIFLGFFVVLFVLLLVSVNGYIAFTDAGTNIQEFVQRTAVADQSRQLDRDIAELLRLANRYGDAGAEEDGVAARSAVEVIRKHLAVARESIANPDWAKHLAAVAEQIDAFSTDLDRLIQTKTEQQRLVREALDPIEIRFFETVMRITNLASKHADPAVTVAAGKLLEHALLARAYVGQTLGRHDANAKPRANNEFAALADLLATLMPTVAKNGFQMPLRDVEANLPHYVGAFDRVSSLMFDVDGLLSGPMAEESNRLAKEAADLAAAASEEARTIQNATVHSVMETSRLVLGLAAVGVGLSVLLALVLGTAISRPVVRMTEAMKKLAAGDMTVLVPDTERRDEIGKMAQALEVFKANAQDLQASEARYRNLLENLTEGVFQTTPEGVVMSVNKACADMLGWSTPDSLVAEISDPAHEFYAPPSSHNVFIRQITEHGTIHAFEETFRRRDGSTIVVSLSARAVREGGKLVRIEGTAVDITEWHRAEQEVRALNFELEDRVRQRTAELAAARDAAEDANKAKSVFLANMSHELRTPLNAILGFSGLLSRDPDVNDSQKEKLDIINRSGEHLLALINDVLDMAKIEAGLLRLECKPFDLGGLVREVTDMMRLCAQEQGLVLLLDQSSSFPGFIQGDEARLRQILVNLVGNAVKFTERGGVTLRLGTSRHDRKRLIMEIEDTGIGIGREGQERLFQPFVQLGGFGANEGTGLGLAITQQVVELMQGTIGVTSTPGKGSIFRVELPFELADESVAMESLGATRAREVCGLTPGHRTIRVLIVEDQRENQLLLTRLMVDVGFEVKLASNGEEAVAMFQTWHPHFIWMDRRMPVMDGIEATRRIRQLPGGKVAKIVAVTASAFEEQRQELLDAGMDDFVRKPYRIEEVYDCLAKQLGVTFRYREAEAGTKLPRALAAAALAVLPSGLQADLKTALERLDSRSIDAAIEKIQERDAGLASILERLARDFDYPAILAGLEAAADEVSAWSGRTGSAPEPGHAL